MVKRLSELIFAFFGEIMDSKIAFTAVNGIFGRLVDATEGRMNEKAPIVYVMYLLSVV